jgi:hypothetical protein
MEGLTEGRVVHFVMPDGTHRPAIIVQVWSRETGLRATCKYSRMVRMILVGRTGSCGRGQSVLFEGPGAGNLALDRTSLEVKR